MEGAISLEGFVVIPAQDTAPAGPITFGVSNDGTIPHKFKAIDTDLGPGDLPVIEEESVSHRMHNDTLPAPI